MSKDLVVERLFESLVGGDRASARQIVSESLRQGVPAATMLSDLFWPAYEMIEKLHRADQMERLAYNLSTRLLRMLVDQAAAHLAIAPARGRTIFAACGPSQSEELAAQMACDLLEASGFEVRFAGGGVPGDELLAQVQASRPDYLLLFAPAASDLPAIREIIDTLREINACPETQVVVGGGVFNRAEGLSDEIGIDLFAPTPLDVVDLLTDGEIPETVAPPAPPARKKSRLVA
jgi:methanogenic corrinoid protein MtbC1